MSWYVYVPDLSSYFEITFNVLKEPHIQFPAKRLGPFNKEQADAVQQQHPHSGLSLEDD